MPKSKKRKIRKAVIPVAGFGTRFLPATIAQPKEMLTVVDKPVIQYIVEEMVASGIEEIIFVTGRNKRAIEDHFDYSAELEQSLRENKKLAQLREVHRISQLAKFVYVRQNKMLGNGHALLMAKEIVGDEPFAFTYGDDIIESKIPATKQIIDAYYQKRTTIVPVVPVEPEQVHRYGIVKPVGSTKPKTIPISAVVEKPTPEKAPSLLALTGRYVLSPDIFSQLERQKPGRSREINVSEALNTMARRKQVYAHQLTGQYFDCGNKLEYVKANIHFALKHRDLRREIKPYLRKPI